MTNSPRFTFDARSKIAVVATLGTLLVTEHLERAFPLWYASLYLLPLIVFLGDRRPRLALIYSLLVLLLGSVIGGLSQLTIAHYPFPLQILYGLILFICYFTGKILPAFFMGYYLIFYTEVDNFILALEKMKLPRSLLIPIAVIFRFFPTFLEEKKSIAMAMKMRGLAGINRFLHPLASFKFLFLPLLMNSLRIADDLSISAVTKGLSLTRERTSLRPFSLRPGDYVLLLFCLFYWVLFFFALSGAGL